MNKAPLFPLLFSAVALAACTGIDAPVYEPVTKSDTSAVAVEPLQESDIWVITFPIEGDPEKFLEAFDALPEEDKIEVFSDCFYYNGCSSDDLVPVAD